MNTTRTAAVRRGAAMAPLMLALAVALVLLQGYTQLLQRAVDRAEQARSLRAALQLRESGCDGLANPHARSLCRLRVGDGTVAPLVREPAYAPVAVMALR